MLIAIGCNEGRPAPAAPSAISPAVEAYLAEMIAIMEAHSLNRLKIDWTAFRASVMAAAGTAQTVALALPAIQTALRLLGDDHSFYRPVSGPGAVAWTRNCGGANA